MPLARLCSHMQSSQVIGTLVLGSASRLPLLDRNGRQLRVGDRLRAQICCGRYGRTKLVEVTVDESFYYLPLIGGPGTTVDFHLVPGPALQAYRKFDDVEHAHESWAEVIN